MAKNIIVNNVTYNSVDSISVPLAAGGGNAVFPETSDANATAGDIASGKTAYVNGSKITGTGAGATLTGDAAVGDVLSGKTFYSNSTTKKTGTMTNQGAVTITPSSSNKPIAAGYHNGSGYVAGDADLVAANIKSGVNIFGVLGEYSGSSTVELGSYVGTGDAGPSAPNVLATPSTGWVGVAIMAEDYSVAAIMQYITEDYETVETPTTFYTSRGALRVDGWSSSSVSWYSESGDPGEQFNENGETYYYCIFGAE